MTTQKFPFGYDPEQLKEMFKVPDFTQIFGNAQIPPVNAEAFLAAQKKNVAALVEMNKIALAGYQDIFKRQAALVEAAVAEARDKIESLQGQPLTAEQAQANLDETRAAVEKALADVRELAEMAQKTNASAFEVVKARFDEALAEFKAGTK